ncbi:pilus assembly protein PilP [Salinisphaera sp. USBA-960]|uniref:pilus assembly protein PilP n=1 Tax=Salinisphaera orenii TaxID=856731 RepID=UPI000DBE5848|nr:pilus assembly protein PilP [Salifodinibacter halophilus]NNC26882.1 pilus assembly protein PilP [Salifodinibacter halophilus]
MAVRRALVGVAALPVVVALAGCGNHDDDARDFVRQVRAEEPAPIKLPPERYSYQPFIYKAGERRQPFQPAHAKAQRIRVAPSSPDPNPDRPREPLEQFSLGALAMVGTITDGDVIYALIKAPSGVIYRVKPGRYMGKHAGKIRQITTNGLLLREIVPKSGGGYRKKRTRLHVGQSG